MKNDAMSISAPTTKAEYIRLLDYAIELADQLNAKVEYLGVILREQDKVAA